MITEEKIFRRVKMREIKVRGYAVEEMIESQWKYGTGIYKVEFADEYAKEIGKKYEFFIFTESGWVEVHGESIGQYTGLHDKNGTEIYEGDVVKYLDGEFSFIAKVAWSDWMWYLEGINPKESFMFDDVADNETADIEIIGNRFEHPHLLEESK